mmetsp:Transcript_9937/g.22942  ORF Transcript_9937/g.22942 Transcript_9937/m.22942 type:complete len:200 (+) Transcript_9937:685-1284(+)
MMRHPGSPGPADMVNSPLYLQKTLLRQNKTGFSMTRTSQGETADRTVHSGSVLLGQSSLSCWQALISPPILSSARRLKRIQGNQCCLGIATANNLHQGKTQVWIPQRKKDVTPACVPGSLLPSPRTFLFALVGECHWHPDKPHTLQQPGLLEGGLGDEDSSVSRGVPSVAFTVFHRSGLVCNHIGKKRRTLQIIVVGFS